MFFPFWYNNDIVFYKSKGCNYLSILNEIALKNRGKQINNDTFEWHINKGVFKTSIPIKIEVYDDELTIKIKYYVLQIESNIIFLLGVLFSIFFYLNGHFNLSISSLILGVIMYILNTLRVNSYVKKQLSVFSKFDNNINRQYLWKQQKEWIKNNSVCPACGEKLNPYSETCTNCRLKIKNNINKPNNISTTGGDIMYFGVKR